MSNDLFTMISMSPKLTISYEEIVPEVGTIIRADRTFDLENIEAMKVDTEFYAQVIESLKIEVGAKALTEYVNKRIARPS